MLPLRRTVTSLDKRLSSGFPREHQQITKRLIANVNKNLVVIGGRDEVFAFVGRRLLCVPDGIHRNAALFIGPIERSFHRDDRIPLCRVPPPRLRINPLLNVEWFDVRHKQIRKQVDERLAVLAVAGICPFGLVLLTPIEKRINDRGDRNGRAACHILRGLLHQLMVLTKRSIAISPPN